MLRRLACLLPATVLALTGLAPTAGAAVPGSVSPGATAPQAPCPAPGPRPVDIGQQALLRQLVDSSGVQLVGPDWHNPAYLPMVRVVWQTVEGLSCTGYVRRVRSLHPGFVLNAAPISGWAWGDWGLTRSGAVTFDFAKWTRAIADHDEGRMVRLIVHELGHAWASDRDSAGYWADYERLDSRLGPISAYGSRAATENFSEIVGYYVARCAKHNPYDTGRFRGYYDYVRRDVFGGYEFGPSPGRTPDCSAPTDVRVVPRPDSRTRLRPGPPTHPDPTWAGRQPLRSSVHRPV